MTDSDRDLAIHARAGRREAFDALVERHGPGVLAFLRRMTGRLEDAQDLFQETFLRAYRSLQSLRDPSLFRPWLVKIAKNAARKHFERQRRPDARPLDVDSAEPEDDDTPSALERIESSERQALVRQAMERLPPRQQAVLSLRLDMNLPFMEIAKALGIREDNARANHYQALRSLKKVLEHLAVPPAPRHGEAK